MLFRIHEGKGIAKYSRNKDNVNIGINKSKIY